MAELSAARFAFLAGTCFLSGAVGTVLASTIRGPRVLEQVPVGMPASPERGGATAEILEEIRALRRELEREPAVRVPVDVPTAGVGEGTEGKQVLEKVQALIASFEQGAGALGAPVSAAQLVQRPPVQGAEGLLSQLDETRGFEQLQAAEASLLDRHLFWTLRDLLEHYGKPQRVSGGDGGILLRYAAGNPSMSFRFWLVDGLVVQAGIDG